MKFAVSILFALVTVLGYRVFKLESNLTAMSRNVAIAALSAEAANDKIGAFAPFFTPDKEKFARAWLDTTNMPVAVFPDEILIPLKRELETRRQSPEAQQLKAQIFR